MKKTKKVIMIVLILMNLSQIGNANNSKVSGKQKVTRKKVIARKNIKNNKKELNSKEYEERKYIMKLFLEVAFELMSKKEKKVYKLRNEENLKHEEISKELGISVVNSRKILYKANQKVMRIANLIEKIKFIERTKSG